MLTSAQKDVNQQQRAQEAKVEDKIRRFLNGRGESTDAALLVAYLEERLRNCYRSLAGSNELITVGRTQGKIEILEQILDLRKE